MLDSICEETFIADRVHLDQRAMHARAKKFLAQTCQRRRLASAEHIRRDCQIELIDEALFQQGSKKGRAAFTCNRADVVLIPQSFQHRSEIDLRGIR